ncbi:MAG TPA: DUF1996 domain-containing protein [Streptosporangiaceae bacterium]|nr:DUF1996 domain-containing protein [Streptosporangiaceae bacterium]
MANLLVLASLAPMAHAATVVDFWIHCEFMTSGTFDPITNPGSTTTEYYNDFFANTTTNPDSTPASLHGAGLGATSCTTSTDTAAYWAPTLTLGPGEVQNNHGVGGACVTDAAGIPACHYTNIRAYYGQGNATGSQLTNIPFGEETVGGNDEATGVQPIGVLSWACGGSTPFHTHPYNCTPYINLPQDQDGVVMRVIVPRCWNGAAATNGANFSYPTNGGTGTNCPANFPKLLPLINLRFHTGIVNPCLGEMKGGKPVSCGINDPEVAPNFGFENANGTMKPWYQAYGDFMNGWQYAPQDNPGGLDDLVNDCLITGSVACPPNPHTGPKSNDMPT